LKKSLDFFSVEYYSLYITNIIPYSNIIYVLSLSFSPSLPPTFPSLCLVIKFTI
jgi:hypothetical protein